MMDNTTLYFIAALLAGTPSLANAGGAIIGDSIAVGLGTQFQHGAVVRAKVGIGSAAIIARAGVTARWVAISAGSNDPNNHGLPANLESIRARVKAAQIIWIIPRNATAAKAVIALAHRHGDATVGFHAGHDGVHPQSYVALARDVAGVIRP